MAFKITTACLRNLLNVQNAACMQEGVRQYSRWMHRKPAKVILPDQENSLKVEKIYDLKQEQEKKKVKKQKEWEERNKINNLMRAEDIIDLNAEEDSDSDGYHHKEDIQQFSKKRDETSIKTNSTKHNKNVSGKKFKQLPPTFDYKEEHSESDANVTKSNTNKYLTQNNEESPSLFNYDDIESKTEGLPKIKRNKIATFNEPRTDDVRKVFDEEGKFIYEKLRDNDSYVSNLMIKLTSRKERGRCGQILVEGRRLVAEGLAAGCELQFLLVSNPSLLEPLRDHLPQEGLRILKMPYREMQIWSSLETNPGIMGIFTTPEVTEPPLGVFPINIICDNIREPGNLGAILRAVMGVGCQRVLLTKGCTDIWDSKVIRSACGAHFQMPITTGLSWDEIHEKVDATSSVFIADNNNGQDSTLKVHKSRNPKVSPQFTFDSRAKTNQILLEDDLPDDEKEPLKAVAPVDIPVLPYYGVPFANMESITLIIGGETEGISEECYRFGQKRKAARLNIPLMFGVDSLNTGSALAVIAFEIKRQLLQSPLKVNQEAQIQAATA